MYTIRRETPFCGRHDGLTELIAIGCHISCSIETLHSRLLAFVDDKTSFRIFFWGHTVDDLRIWRTSDGDEYSIDRKYLASSETETCHSHHASFHRARLGAIVESDICSCICLVDPDIFST